MNLADYEKLDTGGQFNANFVKFTQTGETRYFRFMYISGGEKTGEDIECRRKKWDEENHKYVYDTDDGQLVATLKCIEYDADGKNPRIVRWERSAYFCKTVLLPMWRNYPRVCDGVWKVTANNPGTKEATYTLFPVMSADTVKFPIIEESRTEEKPAPEAEPVKPAEDPKPKKKYWEE